MLALKALRSYNNINDVVINNCFIVVSLLLITI